jgi:quinol monooxygenase YgiN
MTNIPINRLDRAGGQFYPPLSAKEILMSSVLEVAQIEVIEGQEAAFEAAVGEAAPQFEAHAGCRKLMLYASHEFPARYRLVVEWDSVEAHMDFRETPGFLEWRRLASPFFASPPQVEHIKRVLEAF